MTTQTEMQSRAPETPGRGSLSLVQMLVILVVGVTVGATIMWGMIFSGLDFATPLVDGFLRVGLPVLGLLAGAVAFVLPIVWWVLRRFVNRTHGTLDRIVRETAAATRAVEEHRNAAAATHVEEAVREAVAWYGPVAARGFVVRTALGLLVALGGLIGTALLFRQTVLLSEQNKRLAEQTDLLAKQNNLLGIQNGKLDQQTDLLRDQNRKVDLQTVTAEAQRRAGLAAELFSILQAVSLLDAGPTGTSQSQKSAEKLPRGLKARIVALSRAATPYRIVEVPETGSAGEIPEPQLAQRARSPERGQLLVGLMLVGIDILALEGTTFKNADLRDADLTQTNLSGADLNGADLNSTDLTEASLAQTNLTSADLIRANLTRASLTITDLTGANLTEARLTEANLSGANLAGATIARTDLAGANLAGANLTGADLAGANLTGANPIRANLNGANLFGAYLASTDLTGANLIRANLTSADLTGAKLTGADLTAANFNGAQVGTIQANGATPKDFPEGWAGPPPGWTIVDENGVARLRRIAPQSELSSSP